MDIKRKPGRPVSKKGMWFTISTRVSPESKAWLDKQREKGLVIADVIDGLIQANMSHKEAVK